MVWGRLPLSAVPNPALSLSLCVPLPLVPPMRGARKERGKVGEKGSEPLSGLLIQPAAQRAQAACLDKWNY